MKAKAVRQLIAAVGLGLMVLPGAVWANEGKDSGDHVDKRVEHLKEKLVLTEAQAQQVRTILESAKAANEAARAAMQQRKEQTDQQILAVLNDQQKAKYAKMQEEHKKKWEERKEEGHRGWGHKHKEGN